MSLFNSLPNDVFSLKGDAFYKLIQNECGDKVMELARSQGVFSAYSLLYSPSHLFDCIHLNSSDPRFIAVKQKVAFLMNDGTWKIKIDIEDQVENFMMALRAHLWNNQQTAPSPSEDLVISAELLPSISMAEKSCFVLPKLDSLLKHIETRLFVFVCRKSSKEFTEFFESISLFHANRRLCTCLSGYGWSLCIRIFSFKYSRKFTFSYIYFI